MVFVDRSPPLPIMAKAFRVLPNDHESNERFSRMVGVLQESWSTIVHEHAHISPVWPASVALEGFTLHAIAAPYYDNGNVFDYLCRHPSTDRLNIVCQAASALAFIHSKDVVHGNICPGNMCITDDGKVRIVDIGVDTHVRQTSDRYSHSVPKNWMYKACEELKFGIRTMQTDVYSFATTIYSIYTLRPPFTSETHSYGKYLKQITDQGHDGIFGNFKPTKMSDGLWEIIRMSWAIDPFHRPSMVEVEGKLRRMHEFS